jgi:hypothetical protein
MTANPPQFQVPGASVGPRAGTRRQRGFHVFSPRCRFTHLSESPRMALVAFVWPGGSRIGGERQNSSQRIFWAGTARRFAGSMASVSTTTGVLAQFFALSQPINV